MSDEMERGTRLIFRFGEKYGYTPVFGDPNLAKVYNDIELIDYFEHGIQLWIMKPLAALFELQRVNHDPDYGFAMMIIINSIPGFIGKIQGHPEKRQYKEGIKYIFEGKIDEDVMECLREKLRNSVAHNLFTQENITLNGQGFTPVQVNRDETAIVITPIAMAAKFRSALDRFVRELRAELDENQYVDSTWFAKFKEYMTGNRLKYFSVQLHGVSYGYRERIKSYDSITEQIRHLNRFQVDVAIEKPDVVVEGPDQLLELCKQLIRET